MSSHGQNALTSSDDGRSDEHDVPDVSDPEPISKDTQFGMLKNRRRRAILCYLRENDDESTLSDLAEFIAAQENDVERHLLSSDERKRVYIGLYQCHLPKMDEARIIDFEKRSGNVTLRPEADQLFAYLDDDSDAETDPEPDASTDEPVLSHTVKLALGWSLCFIAILSLVGVSVIPPVGLLGGVIALVFAVTETVDAVLTRTA